MNGFKFLLILLIAGWLLSSAILADTTAFLRPTADGTDDSADWENSSATACNATDCYIEVDESSGVECANSDGDTSYILSQVNGASQTFDIDESSIPNNSIITQIDITVCAKGDEFGARIKTKRCIDGNCTDSVIVAGLFDSYREITQPHLGLNITKSDSTDIEIGVINNSVKPSRISQISAVITYTIPTPPVNCGNNNIEPGEECDDGANNGVACTPLYGDTCEYCSDFCQIAQLTGPYCGDNNVDTTEGEKCDDGNTNNNDGCSSICKIEEETPYLPGSISLGRIINVVFAGKAYPDSKIEVLRRGTQDEGARYLTVPFEEYEVSNDGIFDITLGALVADEYFFSLRAEDKDGRKTSTMGFDVDLRVETVEVRDIFMPPTLEIDKRIIARGKEINIFGYASSNSEIETHIDNFVAKKARADENGYWTASINTNTLVSGEHYVKVRQIDSSGNESHFSSIKKFKVSLLRFPKIDFNRDDKINVIDWSVFLFRWGSNDESFKSTIDLNADGKINIFDFSMFLNMMKI